MTELPQTLEDAIAQAQAATQAAIADGYTRLQVELLFPELKLMPVALQFIPALEQLSESSKLNGQRASLRLAGDPSRVRQSPTEGDPPSALVSPPTQLASEEAPAAPKSKLKVFFPDAGAAALARRDWGDVPFKILDVGTGKMPVQQQIQPEDQAFLFIAPTSVEVEHMEKLCNEAGSRPVVLLNPRLENVAIVGIGYAARQLRTRFLNNVESCYHLRPLDGAALFRCYPSPWQVWLETDNSYQMIAERPKKPDGEEIEDILTGSKSSSSLPRKLGLFTNLQRFLRTLSR